jgi:hypothetical protein
VGSNQGAVEPEFDPVKRVLGDVLSTTLGGEDLVLPPDLSLREDPLREDPYLGIQKDLYDGSLLNYDEPLGQRATIFATKRVAQMLVIILLESKS